MRKINFLMMALAFSATSLFGQQYEWGRTFGGAGVESVRAMTVDDASFKSKSGFNRAFKAKTRMTPSQYKKSISSERISA